jgi:hypothetical protein
MADRGQLEGRLLALLDAGRNRTSPGLRGQIASLALMTALVVPLARVDAAIVSLDEGAPVKAARSSLATDFPTAAGSAANDQQDAADGRAAPDDDSTGTWEIRPADGNRVHIRMSENHSSSGQTIPLDAIDGLAAALRGGTGSPVHLTLRRDAGTFTFEGTFRGGVGAGTYAFAPDPSFAAELESRGIGRPSAREQKQLARHDVGLALLDELAAQGYAKPTVGDLVRAGSHGVGVGYVKEMGALGYRLGTIDPLIKMRDHGVGPGFVRDLGKAGLPRLSADDLVRLRDHGVTPEFVVALQQLGYDVRDVDALVTTRDHGVTPEYVREMAAAGYPKLSLKELVTTRDHGVNAELAKAMADLGYTNLPLADLVKARDHGVTASFARELQQLGYRPAAEDLVRARDHGVTPAYLKELKQLGYQNLSLDEAVGLRDHGLSADRIRRENERAGTRLPPDMLKRLN